MSVPVRGFLKSRRDRALGSILGYGEREVQRLLTPEQWQALRAVVIDALNGYHDSVLDLVKAEDGNSIRNDEVLSMLNRIDAKLQSHG